MGTADDISSSSVNDTWKLKRKVVSHNFSPTRFDQKHFKVQEAEATVLMNDFLTEPEDFRQHIRRYSASIIHTFVHGFRAKSRDDFWGQTVFKVTNKRSECMEPGAYPPVELFPFLKLIPERFAPWKTMINECRKLTLEKWKEARERVTKRRECGDKRDCIVDDLLDEYGKTGPQMPQGEFDKWMGEIIEGDADTSGSTSATLLLAFAKNTEIKKKAQAEIDKVCEAERSPVWADFDELPSFNMLIKESLRWRPIAPMGVPRRLREESDYNGMRMPKE